MSIAEMLLLAWWWGHYGEQWGTWYPRGLAAADCRVIAAKGFFDERNEGPQYLFRITPAGRAALEEAKGDGRS